MERSLLKFMHSINKNCTTDIVTSGKRLKAPPVISQKKSIISTFATSIQHSTTIFAKVIGRKRNKTSILEKKHSYLYSQVSGSCIWKILRNAQEKKKTIRTSKLFQKVAG